MDERRRRLRERRAARGSRADEREIRREALARGEIIKPAPGDLVAVVEKVSPWIGGEWRGVVTEVSPEPWPFAYCYVRPLTSSFDLRGEEWWRDFPRGAVDRRGVAWDERRGVKLSMVDEVRILEVGHESVDPPPSPPRSVVMAWSAYQFRDGRYVHPDCLSEHSKPIDSKWRSLAVERHLVRWPRGKPCAICGGRTKDPRP